MVHTLDGSAGRATRALRIAINHTRWHAKLVGRMVDTCVARLRELDVAAVETVQVAGSFELPLMAKRLLLRTEHPVDAVICIGILVKGATMHFEYISEAVSHGLMQVNLDTLKPVSQGMDGNGCAGLAECTTKSK